MGLKRIAAWLNDNNIRTRGGGRWGLGAVHEVLTRTTYIGQHRFNRRSGKSKSAKPAHEQTVMEVPAIVTEAEFEAVQRSLRSRNRMAMPPRAVGGPTLLTGICFCACCGGAMTLRTGRGSNGSDYRYYTCSTKARQGVQGCPGITVPMDTLDRAVVEHVESRLLEPERLEEVLEQLLERRDEWADRRRQHAAELERRATEAEAKLKRLYEAIENGVVDMNDPSLKDRIAELTVIRDQARGDAERAVAQVERLAPGITVDSLREFALVAKRKLRNGDGSFARDYVRAVAQRIEVVSRDLARLHTDRDELLRTITAASGVEAAVLGVKSFEPKWLPGPDSHSLL